VIERALKGTEECPAGDPQSPLSEFSAHGEDLSAAQLAELGDEARQAEYQRQFELQMRRRYCPGCGE